MISTLARARQFQKISRVEMMVWSLYFCLVLFTVGCSSQILTCPNISRFDLNGNIIESYQINNDIIMVLTSSGYVYRSVDGLQTLTQLTTADLVNFNVKLSLVNGITASGIEGGIMTADPQVMYFYGGGGRVWTTRNGGANFTLHNVGFEILLPSAEQHSTDANKLLFIGADVCCNIGSGCSNQCIAPVIYFALDYAATWTSLDYVINSVNLGSTLTWGYGAQKDWIYYITPERRIRFSPDFGVNKNELSTYNNVIYFFYDEINLAFGYVTDSLKYGGPLILNYAPILASTSSSFVGKIMPITIQELLITFQDFDTGFIYAIAFKNNAVFVPQPINTFIDLCHLLVSNSDNFTDFTLGLANITSNGESGSPFFGYYDFVVLSPSKSSNPRGIAIANVMQDPLPNSFVSKITFNAGVSWSPITVRECGSASLTACSLHFIGPAQGVLGVFRKLPVGIHLVIGSVGQYQNKFDSSFGLYMSRDYGQSFYKIMNLSSTTFNVGYDVDSSSNAVVVVRSDQPTTIFTTFDDGVTWSACNLTDSAVDASSNITWSLGNIYSESNFGTNYEIGSGIVTTFFVTAKYSQNTGGTVVTGDTLFRYHIASLDGVPICASTDYLTVTIPLDSSKCILGKKTQLSRKSEDVNCQIDETVVRNAVVTSNCNCQTADDYLCGLCLVHSSSNQSLCVEDTQTFLFCSSYSPSNMPNVLARSRDSSSCPAFFYYEYSLVSGDTCTNSDAVITATRVYDGCNYDDSFAIAAGIAGGLMGLSLLFIVVILIYSFIKENPEIEKSIENLPETVKDNLDTTSVQRV